MADRERSGYRTEGLSGEVAFARLSFLSIELNYLIFWSRDVIALDVNMSFDEYFRANKAWISTSRKQQLWFWVVMYVFPALGLASFVIAALSIWQNRSLVPAAIPYLMWGVWGCFCRLAYQRRVRKLYKIQAAEFFQRMEISEEGIFAERKDGTATFNYRWSGIARWIEKPEFFLLFPNERVL